MSFGETVIIGDEAKRRALITAEQRLTVDSKQASGDTYDVNVTNPSFDVFVQDQSTEIIDLYFSKEIQTITLSANQNIDDTVIRATMASSAPTVGSVICLKEGTAFYQGEVVSFSLVGGLEYDITLDTPLDYAFTTAGGCSERTCQMNVDGSSTTQEFSISPSGLDSSVSWDVTRVLFQMTDATAMDDGKFGGVASLTNGIVLRKVDGVTKNIFNVKNNGEFALRMYDVQYVDSTLGPSGLYAMRARRTFSGQDKNGVVIRLNAATNDTLVLLIRDDLTGLSSFNAVVQGHIVEN